MKYSIIIPCYNASATLENAVMRIRMCGMTDYEIMMVMLGILALLISSCSLLITLLSFFDKRNDKRK